MESRRRKYFHQLFFSFRRTLFDAFRSMTWLQILADFKPVAYPVQIFHPVIQGRFEQEGSQIRLISFHTHHTSLGARFVLACVSLSQSRRGCRSPLRGLITKETRINRSGSRTDGKSQQPAKPGKKKNNSRHALSSRSPLFFVPDISRIQCLGQRD